MQGVILKLRSKKSIIAMLILMGLTLIPLHVISSDNATAKNNEKTKNLIENKKGSTPLPIGKGKFMFSVTLHKQKEIKSLLTRVDSLSKTMRIQGNDSKIALILHGPEIKFFSKKNYGDNKPIVDKAANLDGNKIIEIKVCKSKMDELGIEDKDIPSFVEIIPYAPDEEKKLRKKGYIYL